LIAALLLGAEEAEALFAEGVNLDGASAVLQPAPPADWTLWLYPDPAPSAQVYSQIYPTGSLTGLFNSGGFLGRFAAGFLGSGVLGLLFGRGLVGDLSGVPSYLGLACQLALLSGLGWLIWTRWRGGATPRRVALSPRQLADGYLRSRDDLHSGSNSIEAADNGGSSTAREYKTGE
jgi:hypothetical protein